MLHNEFVKGALAPSSLPLREEIDVMKTWRWNGAPLVSICCATFNHVQYLEDALRGFLGQVTSFPFEVVIRDDASTDGTTEILTKYAVKYPNIIRAVIETENKHSKGIRANPALVPLARGEFIALCEGDDYWIASDKLEKQMALLRAHPQATMSVARTVVCKPTGNQLICENLFMGNNKELLDFEDIKTYYFHTSTYLIRTDVYKDVLARYANKIEYGDTALRYMLADVGPFALLKEVVSVYRITGSGIWTSLEKPKQVAWEIKAAEDFYQHFSVAHRRYFGMKLFVLYKWMLTRRVWAFNFKSPYFNFKRFLYFTLMFGVDFYWIRLVRRLARK